MTGQVGYRQHISLPESARINVVLIDKSVEDETVIASQTIEPTGLQMPFDFNITFDNAKIDPSHSYAVTANVEIHGEEFYRTNSDYLVITGGNPTQGLEIVMDSAL